jgi:hypothetical protein
MKLRNSLPGASVDSGESTAGGITATRSGGRSVPATAAGTASRPQAWKVHLRQLSDEAVLAIAVCHYPPATSKWNKIELRLFPLIGLNWKGKPPVNFETAVSLTGGTRTKTGLRAKAGVAPASI